MLTLSDYQKEALKTSDETNTLEYCVLGLVSEAGEVAGVVKKWLRGDYGEATMRAKMLDELGDVLWYVALTADRVKESMLGRVTFTEFHEFTWNALEPDSRRLGRLVSFLVHGTTEAVMADGDFQNIRDCLPGTVASLSNLAFITGHTLDGIAAHNIAKLRDRQQRGVIRGSGDRR